MLPNLAVRSPGLAKHTVLLVEDEENLLEAIRYNLQREDYAVLTATDGEQALESGQAALVPVSLQLDMLVGEVKAAFEAWARAKGITLEATIPDTVPRVMGEADKLRAVLVNLLDNAMKFTPAGGEGHHIRQS